MSMNIYTFRISDFSLISMYKTGYNPTGLSALNSIGYDSIIAFPLS